MCARVQVVFTGDAARDRALLCQVGITLLCVMLGTALVFVSPFSTQLQASRNITLEAAELAASDYYHSGRWHADGWATFNAFVEAQTITFVGYDSPTQGRYANAQTSVIACAAVLCALASVTGVAQYFITYSFNSFSKGCLLVSCGIVAVGMGILQWGFRSEFVTLSGVAALGYYLALMLASSVLEWRAHDWNFTRNVRVLLSTSMMLVFIAAATLTFRGACFEYRAVLSCPIDSDPGVPNATRMGAGVLTLWSLCAAAAGVSYLKRLYGDRLAPWILPTAAVTLSLLTIVGCHFIGGMGIAALTLVCTLTTVGLLSGGLGLPHYHVRSNYILPVWVYDPKADEFRQANASVLRVIAGLWVVLFWAGVVVYTQLTTIPSLVSSFSVSLFYMYTMSAIHSDQVSGAKLASDLTPEMVAQAVHVLKRRLKPSDALGIAGGGGGGGSGGGGAIGKGAGGGGAGGTAAVGARRASRRQSAMVAPTEASSMGSMGGIAAVAEFSFADVKDTCDEKIHLQFGTPARAQLEHVLGQIHNMLAGESERGSAGGGGVSS